MSKEKPKKADKSQKLLEAARLGQLQQLQLLLNQLEQSKSKKKANPLASLRKSPASPNNIRDPVTGFTCLHHSALNGHLECVELLLERGANINALDYKGSSTLHLAAWAGNLEITRSLLGWASRAPLSGPGRPAGLQLDLCNNENQTPLSLAAQFGHNAVVSELLAHGANPHIRNSRLESPLELACLNGRLETVNILLRASPILVAELRKAKSSILVRNPLLERHPQSFEPASAGEPLSPGSQSSSWTALLAMAGGSRCELASEQQQRSARLPGASLRQNSSQHPDWRWPHKSPEKKPAKERRRATLSISGPLPLNYNPQEASVERMLEHSPLHYAVRKNHTNVVHLLLYHFGANLLQVSSLGSVLHEIALSCNQGRHSDMISLIFQYIGGQFCAAGQESRIGVLNKLLNLKNNAGKSVFDVLNEINNRTSQDIKRLIYQFSEQQLTAANSNSNLNKPINAQVKQAHHQIDPFNSSQAIETRGAFLEKHQQFSDMQQINSFVTMKRAPKLQNCFPNYQDPYAGFGPLPVTTQTIGRRRAGANPRIMDGYPEWFQPDGARECPAEVFRKEMHQFPATRSVSNLTQAGAEEEARELRFPGPLAGQRQVAAEASKQHSKSRDLGSILRDASHAEPTSGANPPTRLYAHASCASPFENVPQQAGQLVRSQTDCSHLMGRFFGDQTRSLVSDACEPNELALAARFDCPDRKTINRHYHVYEHEFFPPRILPAGQQPLERKLSAANRQAIAVVTPLAKPASELLSADFRSSVRSNEFRPEPQAASARRALASLNRAASVQQPQPQQPLPAGQKLNLLIPSSLSLESHLNEPHLFESTRQALMKDFDKLIGEELLNRNHKQIIEGSLAGSSRSQSILTGITLNMDTFGERLTVSGTRLTLPAQSSASSATCQPRSGSSLQSDSSVDESGHSPLSLASHGTQTSTSDLTSGQAGSDKPSAVQPVARQRESKKEALKQQPHPVIYDLPNVAAGDTTQSAALKANRSGSRVLKLTAQFSAGERTASKASLTEPPAKPPPPPPSQSGGRRDSAELFNSPLEILAAGNQPSSLSSVDSSSSTSSNAEFGLLKITSTPAPKPSSLLRSNDSSLQPRFMATRGAVTSGDPDSGICTSNSPASTGNDSEACLSSSNLSQKAAELSVLELPTELEVGPPSPRTAQLRIEEALMPLAKIEFALETENRTTSPMSSLSAATSTGESASAVDRWLRLDCASPAGDSHSIAKESHYENCLALQQQLTLASSTDDDDDYALDSPEAEESSAGSRASPQSPEAEPPAGDLHSAPTELKSARASRKKEVLLKVVIDGNVKSSNGDEVFYIDPLELRRLAGSSNESTPKMENAETLTEEELCAAIDKDSGYIKFMLRKRQQSHDGSSDSRSCQSEDQDKKRTKLHELASKSLDEWQPTGEPARKISAASLAVVEMEVSQAGSSPLTSSSSSKESIKSIVQLRRPPLPPQPPLPASRPAQADSEDTEAAGSSFVERSSPRQGYVMRVANPLVSETARKLEAAAANAKQRPLKVEPPPRPPVAAARRLLNANLNQNKLDASELKEVEKPQGVRRSVRSVCWPPCQSRDESNKENTPLKAAPQLPPPPTSATITQFNEAKLSRHSSSLSSEESKEEQPQVVGDQLPPVTSQLPLQPKQIGPKPAPPAKPAKLAVGTLNTKLCNKL